MENSPNLREAASAAQAARARAYQAGLYPNPVLYTASPQWTARISQYNIFVGQDFITKGKLRLDRQAAARIAQQADFAYDRVRYDVLSAVRSNYYAALVGQERVAVLEELVEIASNSKQTADRLFQADESAEIDSWLLGIELDRAQVALQNADTILRASKARLAAAMGVMDAPIDRLEEDFSAPLPDFRLEALRQGVLDRNANLAIAQTDVAKSRVQLRRAIVDPYPNFNVQGGFQYGVEAPFHNQGYAQFSMIVPIWNRNQGGIQAARREVSASGARVGRVENELASQAATALGAYRSATQLVDRYEESILPMARKTMHATRLAYKGGEFDFLRLLSAQRTFAETRLAYINAQEDRWQAAVEIAGLLQVEEFP